MSYNTASHFIATDIPCPSFVNMVALISLGFVIVLSVITQSTGSASFNTINNGMYASIFEVCTQVFSVFIKLPLNVCNSKDALMF